MRVCQPRPVERKASSTSRSKRTVVDTLVGDCCLPRPFKASSVVCNDSGNAENGTARLKSAVVYSGLSSSINSGLGFIVLNLTFIGFSKADHSNAADDFYEYQTIQRLSRNPMAR
jgi:hypothetical protein